MTRRQGKPKGKQSSPKKHENVASKSEATARFSWLQVCYAATIFLSAFLLFQVQPLISKAILPWFGGTPAVWTTCMLFFQVLLFAGYAYAHVSRFFSPLVQGLFHGVIVLSAWAFLPIYPSAVWQPTDWGDPTWRIIRLLTATIGIQFFLLATTAPLLQSWWNRVFRGSPYHLYALSNIGSLLALLTYPFLIEPLLGVRYQAMVWSWAFVVYSLLLLVSGIAAWRSNSALPSNGANDENPEHNSLPSLGLRFVWLALSAGGSVLLLAMTNHICQDVAVVPFLWVAPLALYLLTFVLCFGARQWYRRIWFVVAMIATSYLCAARYYDYYGDQLGLTVDLIIHLGAMFAGCMVFHGELERLKPTPRHLTSFYLHMSAGGALGGIFIGLVAPHLFDRYYEYPLIMITCWLVALMIFYLDRESKFYRGRLPWAWAIAIAIFASYVAIFSNGVVWRNFNAERVSRNFYGVLMVVPRLYLEKPEHNNVALYHGMIEHGFQFTAEDRKQQPTSYYAEESGVGVVMRQTQQYGERRIGVVGLGIGTLASYGQKGDYFRFYEINPTVEHLAHKFFEFLSDTPANFEVILGDARTSLAREAEESPQDFDVLVLDAFSGDAIPVHLLTREAFSIYLTHAAKPSSIIAVHISNRKLDLFPLLESIASHFQLEAACVVDEGDEATMRVKSYWVLMARRGALDVFNGNARVLRLTKLRSHQLWTDDYSNVLSLIGRPTPSEDLQR